MIRCRRYLRFLRWHILVGPFRAVSIDLPALYACWHWRNDATAFSIAFSRHDMGMIGEKSLGPVPSLLPIFSMKVNSALFQLFVMW